MNTPTFTPTAHQQQAIEAVEKALEDQGWALLTGYAGTGKSAL